MPLSPRKRGRQELLRDLKRVIIDGDPTGQAQDIGVIVISHGLRRFKRVANPGANILKLIRRYTNAFSIPTGKHSK